MPSRTLHYLIIGVLVLSFVASLYNIRNVTAPTPPPPPSAPTDTATATTPPPPSATVRSIGRFVLPTVAMVTFFVACYFISILITEGETTGKDKYAGILFLAGIGLILTVFNFTVLAKHKLDAYVKGKKFSVIGLFMALGVSAIVFGFLDNFGMKLGTEALDDTFLQAFLHPFSQDERFLDHRANIQQNLQTINEWTTGDWRKVVNHALRFEDDLQKHPKFKDLSNAIRALGTSKLDIPPEILRDRERTNQYVDNLRDKYDIIDGSKSMLGNTFSDFIGAILGAALVNLFIYMTNYDGFVTGDDAVDENPLVKYLSYYAPFMEAIFIALGCLVPVFLNIAMNRRSNKSNNFYAWMVVGVVGALMILMMYLSSRGVQAMTPDDKRRAIAKTLAGVRERVDLQPDNAKEAGLRKSLDAYLQSLQGTTTGDDAKQETVGSEAEDVQAATAVATTGALGGVGRPRSL